MALKVRWKRELLPAEKRVDFKKLQDGWFSAEEALVDDLIPVLNQMIARLERDVRSILDSKNYGKLNELKIGYKDKLVGVFKSHMSDAFKTGKLDVYKEFGIKKEYVFNAPAREYINVKAETTVTDLLDRIKSKTLFTILNGIKAGYTTDQIIKDIKGKPFKEQQAEVLNAVA